MTIDDVEKAVVAAVAFLGAWLWRVVTGTKDDVLVLKEQHKVAESERAALRTSAVPVGRVDKLETRVDLLHDEIANVQKTQLTLEDVRRVLEEALDRRDKVAEDRRSEFNRRLQAEIKTTVIDEIRRATQAFRRPHHRDTGVDESPDGEHRG